MNFRVYTFYLIRDLFVRNLYWDVQIAKKPSVLKPQRLRETCNFFFHFQYHNFEETVTIFDKDMLSKETYCDTNSYSLVLYLWLFVFSYKTVFSVAHCCIVRKMLRNC